MIPTNISFPSIPSDVLATDRTVTGITAAGMHPRFPTAVAKNMSAPQNFDFTTIGATPGDSMLVHRRTPFSRRVQFCAPRVFPEIVCTTVADQKFFFFNYFVNPFISQWHLLCTITVIKGF
jgi:hypothetical protein